MEQGAFFISFSLYLAGSVGYLLSAVLRSGKAGLAGYICTWGGFAAHSTAVLLRMLTTGRLAGYTLFEYLVLFAWGTVMVFLVSIKKDNRARPGIFILPLTCLLFGYASLLPVSALPLVPMLRGMWLQLHIVTSALAYSLFACSLASALVMITGRNPDRINAADHLMVSLNAVGFFFLSLGIATGAVWAEHVWASFWSWDPKETASLVTWLVYALGLHARYGGSWSRRGRAWITVVGFTCVLFTFLGVDLLVPRAHTFLFR